MPVFLLKAWNENGKEKKQRLNPVKIT